MKLITITMPARWASALINIDYSGLEKSEIGELNNKLLNQGVLFNDCLDMGDPFTGRFDGKLCLVAEYSYKAA